MDIVDQYVWNDQTEVVDHLFPNVEEDYPEIARWFELRQGHAQAAVTPGVVTVRFMSHTWIGCPVDMTVEQLVRRFAC